jgi:uncharacterized membrane protein YfcA
VAAQLAAPYVRGAVLIGLFAIFCLLAAVRFAAPGRFRPAVSRPPNGKGQHLAGVSIGLISGFAGVGGGIMTNIVMSLCGISMHKSIGRAAAVGVVVGAPATIVAALAPYQHMGNGLLQLGSISLTIWVFIAPVQALGAWGGAMLARYTPADTLSRVFAAALVATGFMMLKSSL